MNQQPTYMMIESDGSCIYQTNQIGGKTLLGYTTGSYEQLMAIAEQYKKKLEDAGLIEKKLTPEEIQKKQAELMEKMLNNIDSISKRLENLEGSLGGVEDVS